MQGLSFREYLELFHGIITPVRSLEDVLSGNIQIDGVQHPIPLFGHYLREGYFPFAKEGYVLQRLQQVIRLTMEVDIPQYANMSPATGKKLRRMLTIIRETFFYNQTRLTQDVTSSKVSDFSIGKFTFEVGGAKKSHRQVKDVENSFIVRDDIEYASGDIIPLWGFGLMY